MEAPGIQKHFGKYIEYIETYHPLLHLLLILCQTNIPVWLSVTVAECVQFFLVIKVKVNSITFHQRSSKRNFFFVFFLFTINYITDRNAQLLRCIKEFYILS